MLYKRDQIKLREVKAFCSENVLRNIINLSRRNELDVVDFENMDVCLKKQILLYFKSKYPETLECQVNMALAKRIVGVDNMDSNDYDMVLKSGVRFEMAEDGNYNSKIMELINYVVQVPQGRVKGGRKGEDVESIYGSFEEKMNGYMKMICTRPQDRQEGYRNVDFVEGDEGEEMRVDVGEKIGRVNKQVKGKDEKQKIKEYEDKVLSYSSFEIGQKLSKNFELYSDGEIEQGGLRFRNSAQIRVLTKWC